VSRVANYKKLILLKPLEHGYVGGRHTNEDNIPNGFHPSEYRDVMKAYKEIKREGFLILTPKPDGIHISINPRMVKQIQNL